jgi:hypothetical protein
MLHWLHEAIGPILAAIGGVFIGGGTITAFALWLFKQFSERWLQSRFAERLAAFRHEQEKELEHLRFEISKLLDRTVKFHQREFEVLPQAWTLLTKSYYTTLAVTSSLQSYPDLSNVGDVQLEEFLADSKLNNWQKAELKVATDRNKYYQDAIFWHRLNGAKQASRTSTEYLTVNGIFMRPELKEKFDQIDDLGWQALVEHEFNQRSSIFPKQMTEQKKFGEQGPVLLRSLEREIQKRLWSETV